MTDKSRRLSQVLRCAAISVAALTVIGVVLTLGPGAGWVLRYIDGVHGLKGKELEDALDAVRGRALALGTGVAALVAVYYTARNADTARKTLQSNVDAAVRTAAISEQGQVTERYTKAIEQLGSDKPDIRLGGIYALERIATDSARDHPAIMEVLTSFIREHTTTEAPRAIAPADKTAPPPVPQRPVADIRAAATVIGRRTTSHDTRKIDLSRSNLTRANLRDANLRDADLRDANLFNADLRGADLGRADLRGANLLNVNLQGANLRGADLSNADLSNADLSVTDLLGADLINAKLINTDLGGANLRGAHLRDADLRDADLSSSDPSGADLRGANLSGVNLRDADLSGAELDGADLRGADLRGANLSGTYLSDADVRGANVADVRFTEETRWPEGFGPSRR